MPGVPAIWQLHRYEQMHHIVTIILPVPNLMHDSRNLPSEYSEAGVDDARWAINGP